MEPGKWQILKDGIVIISAYTVNEEQCVLFFEGANGTYEVKKLT